MLLDNENQNLKGNKWITPSTDEGKLDIFTGYFTITALACLSKSAIEEIFNFRFVPGDILTIVKIDNHPLDLLNETISI